MKKKQEHLLFSLLFACLTAFLLFSFRQLLVTMSDTWANLNLSTTVAGLLAPVLFFTRQRKRRKEPVNIAAGILALGNVLGILCLLLSASALGLWCLAWIFGGAPDIH